MTTLNVPGHDQQRLLGDAIRERRATPSFDGSPVPEDVLSLIIKVGMEAPSGYDLHRATVLSSASLTASAPALP
jgi:hypothetical protein